jgi:hypothetical protein
VIGSGLRILFLSLVTLLKNLELKADDMEKVMLMIVIIHCFIVKSNMLRFK